jgi:hypothetical protein
VIKVLLTLGFWVGLLILSLIYGRRIGRLISMKLEERSHYTSYHYIHKRRHRRNRLESILILVSVALIILGILTILGVFG